MTHTKGPWERGGNGRGGSAYCVYQVAGEGDRIVDTRSTFSRFDAATQIANGNLIAEAPNMLEALEGLCVAYAACNGAEGPEYGKAMATIAKAKGT